MSLCVWAARKQSSTVIQTVRVTFKRVGETRSVSTPLMHTHTLYTLLQMLPHKMQAVAGSDADLDGLTSSFLEKQQRCAVLGKLRDGTLFVC